MKQIDIAKYGVSSFFGDEFFLGRAVDREFRVVSETMECFFLPLAAIKEALKYDLQSMKKLRNLTLFKFNDLVYLDYKFLEAV